MHDFTVLILSGAHASSVAVTLDVLEAAARLAPLLQCPSPRWRIVSAARGAVPLTAGLQRDAAALPRSARGDASTWIIPGLAVDRVKALQQRLAQDDAQGAIRALQRHVGAGGSVAASCSAVFLLQAAGLLAGRRVTTSWWLAPELQRLEPGCTVNAERMVCADGPVSTAGAAFAQADLMLHLLRTRFGPALAEAVSRVLLIDARQAQAPFVVPAMLANGDQLIARLTERIEASLPHSPSIATLAGEMAMSQRTLSRRVRAVTGKSPLALVQSVRLNRARALIESTRLSIERIAEQVGYEDATALRRLMRKTAGAAPSRFRTLMPAE